jgi:hypothetical protein
MHYGADQRAHESRMTLLRNAFQFAAKTAGEHAGVAQNCRNEAYRQMTLS